MLLPAIKTTIINDKNPPTNIKNKAINITIISNIQIVLLSFKNISYTKYNPDKNPVSNQIISNIFNSF